MVTFKGKLFGDEIALSGEQCSAYFSDTAFHVDGQPAVAILDLSSRAGGFDHNELFFSWQDKQGSNYTFMPSPKSEVIKAVEQAPILLQEGLKQWKFRKRSISIIWTSIITFLVAALLTTVLVWWKYDEVLTWVTTHISIKNEEALGKKVFAQIETNTEFITDGPAHTALVEIGTLLSKNSAYQYQWHIAKDAQVNAFAVPGGIIIVNSGLLTAIESPDELAAVLAHEIQHIEQRHALKNMINSAGWAAGMLVLIGDVNIVTAVVIHQLGNLYFGREKEEEADYLGLELLIAQNINPNGMLTFMKRLEQENAVNSPVWLSSHPTTSDRIQQIENKINSSACNTCKSLDYDWQVIKTDPLLLGHDE